VAEVAQADELQFLAGGGLSGMQLRALDWTTSSLGPPTGWPDSLRRAVKLMLDSRHPLSILWGPEAIHLFNDAAGQSFGAERRASGIAQPAAMLWSEIWDVIGPQFDQVMGGGSATWHENQLVPIIRNGRLEDTYWTYSFSPIYDPLAPSEVGGVFVIFTETTETLLAEKRGAIEADLPSTEERLRLATEAADIGWWDVEAGHGRLSWPPRVKAMFGISPEVPVTMDDFYNGLHPDDHDRVAAVYAGAADPARRELYDVEYRTIGKEDGILRWVSAKGRGVFDETGSCKRVIGTAIDITERKLAQEAKLAREREDAELREQFIAVLGHDLRNPLASIAAGTQLLMRHPERLAAITEQMERSISRMSALIENVLDFARGRLGGGFVTTRDSEKPLHPVLLQVIEELRNVHPERHVEVDIDLHEPVRCDRQRIGQLLSNLLGNAFVYGTPDAPIQVRARAENGQFELSVTNFGETIEPSALERLFQPFFRGRVRDSREGLGLGLYICCEIAKAHEGTLDVTSESGTTCFTLRMPTVA
jgi:PAS domain S-box-containing protein